MADSYGINDSQMLLNNIHKYDLGTQQNFLDAKPSTLNDYRLASSFNGMAGSPLTKGEPGLYSNSRIQSTDYNLKHGISGMSTTEDGFQDMSAKSPDMFPAESVAASIADSYKPLGSSAPLSYFNNTPTELDASGPTVARSHVTSYDKMMANAGPYSDPKNTQSYVSTPNSDTGMLGSIGSAMGFKGWGDGLSNGDIYKDDASGKYMRSGWLTDSSAKLGDFNTLEDANKAGVGLGLTADQFRTAQTDQARLDNQQFSTYAGAGMGAAQLGLGVLSYLDNRDMNKKNSELIDQQIANNQDIMNTRTQRAHDIKKYFG